MSQNSLCPLISDEKESATLIGLKCVCLANKNRLFTNVTFWEVVVMGFVW